MQKAPQLPVTGGVVRGICSPVVLLEEFLAFWFGEVSKDRQWIGRVFRRPRSHAT